MITLSISNQLVLIDDEDLHIFRGRSWHIEKGRYAVSYNRFNKTVEYMHRLVLNYTGPDDVDHINHNPRDNQKSNLRIILHHLNIRHRKQLQRNNTTGHNGVRWRGDRNKWQAYTMHLRKQINLGMFETLEEAIAARAAFDADFKKEFGV